MKLVTEYRNFSIYLTRDNEYFAPALDRLHTRKTLKTTKKDIDRRIAIENRRLANDGTL